MVRMVDGIAQSGEGVFLLLGRLGVAALFLPSGYGKLMAALTLPGPAMAWLILAGLIELFGGLGLVLGFRTRVAAALVCIFTIVAAFIGHPYWTIDDAAARMPQYINFWKDIAIAGGLLFLFVRGAGAISLDRR